MRRNLLTAVLLAGTSASVLLAASNAHAGGFSSRQQSATGQGFSFAGAGTSAFGLSSMFWNPANITNFEGRNSEWNAGLVVPSTKVDTTASGYANPALAGALNPLVPNRLNSSGNINQGTVITSSYSSYQLNNWLWVGLQSGAPFGSTTKADRGFAGSVFGASTKIKTMAMTPTIGIKLNDWISFGFGVTVQDFKTTQNGDGSAYWTANGFAPPANRPGLFAATAMTSLKGDAYGVGATAGVTVKPWTGGEISLGYRSSIRHSLRGTLTALTPAGPSESLVKANLNLPEIVTLGLKQDINQQWTVTGTAQWTNWSRLKAPAVVGTATGLPITAVGLRYRDEWFLAAGVQYNWNQNLSLRAGLAYEISPITDETRGVRVLDSNRLWVSAGLGYKISNQMQFDLGYSYLALESGKVNIVGPGNPLNPVGNPSFTGATTYSGNSSGHVHILSASLKYRWDTPAAAPVRPVVAKY